MRTLWPHRARAIASSLARAASLSAENPGAVQVHRSRAEGRDACHGAQAQAIVSSPASVIQKE